MTSSGVYCIRNVANGHLYVGSSVYVKKRRSNHFSDIRQGVHHSNRLKKAFEEFGSGNFEFEIILMCPVDLLEYYEQQIIDQLNPEYNKVRKVQPLCIKKDYHAR
jgi:group I intron endonuclease